MGAMADEPPPTDAAAAPLDPSHADVRELMQTLLPAARTRYIKVWELLADSATIRDRREAGRATAAQSVEEIAAVTQRLREREASLSGNDLENARYLGGQLDRLSAGFEKLSAISAMGLAKSEALRPDTLGCGKRFRQPASPDTHAASRGVSSQPPAAKRGSQDRKRGADQPFSDRGPKVSRDKLGSSAHHSPLADDLDAETRARLEALRGELEAGE